MFDGKSHYCDQCGKAGFKSKMAVRGHKSACEGREPVFSVLSGLQQERDRVAFLPQGGEGQGALPSRPKRASLRSGESLVETGFGGGHGVGGLEVLGGVPTVPVPTVPVPAVSVPTVSVPTATMDSSVAVQQESERYHQYQRQRLLAQLKEQEADIRRLRVEKAEEIKRANALSKIANNHMNHLIRNEKEKGNADVFSKLWREHPGLVLTCGFCVFVVVLKQMEQKDKNNKNNGDNGSDVGKKIAAKFSEKLGDRFIDKIFK